MDRINDFNSDSGSNNNSSFTVKSKNDTLIPIYPQSSIKEYEYYTIQYNSTKVHDWTMYFYDKDIMIKQICDSGKFSSDLDLNSPLPEIHLH